MIKKKIAWAGKWWYNVGYGGIYERGKLLFWQWGL